VEKAKSKHKSNKKELHPFYLYIKESEKKQKREYEQFLEHLSDTMAIPKDVIAGQAVISMLGNHSIRVCNYRSIEEYSTESIRLSLGKKSLVINGSQLFIEFFRKDEIKIVGNISNISFIR